MLKIAVCDDEEADLERTVGLLRDYFCARPALGGQVSAFTGSRALLDRAVKQGGFDCYVLDILMPEESGIEAGRRLRAQRDSGEIVYLTNVNDFAADSYDVQAFFYLLKPVEEEKLFSVMDRVIEKLGRKRSSAVVVQTTEGQRRLLLERIQYVERIGRVMRYHCVDGTVDSRTVRVSFREMAAPLLADPRFCQCGASFVLNFQHVAAVKGQTVLLDDGKTVSLPRTAAASFKSSWGEFWLKGE